MPLSEEETEKAQHAGRSLLEMLWEELDQVTEKIMSHDRTDSFAADTLISLKGEAKGLAKAIIIFHRPFFDDGVSAVSREALVRYKNKKAGEEYHTVGLAERRYEMPESKYKVIAAVAAHDPVLAEIQGIPDAHKATIRKATQAGKALATLFGVSEAAIERVRNGE